MYFENYSECEWIYLQRVVPNCDEEYEVLRNAIHCSLIPAILGREVLQREFNLLELPVRLGGMAFRDPVKTAAENYKV